jgi:hypothetical protein
MPTRPILKRQSCDGVWDHGKGEIIEPTFTWKEKW